MRPESDTLAGSGWALGVFVGLQLAVMAVAIDGQSLWIDEFWTAYFGSLPSLQALVDLVMVPSGSQTPLHFLHYFLWGRVFEGGEFVLRLANLPLFVMGQVSLYMALRPYPRAFATLFLAVSALHPMVWQYANEARPYMMIIAGSQMVLAYLLHLHARDVNDPRVSLPFTAVFVVGGLMLFGASLLGAFWVFSAVVYAAVLHHRHGHWRYLIRGASLAWVAVFLACTAVLSAYYLNSLLQGAGGSRIASTNLATMAFSAYELLGLSGIGPGRHELRDDGLAALPPHAAWLALSVGLLLTALAWGLRDARRLFHRGGWWVAVGLAVLPVAIVIFSGYAMHWRVLGRHLLATLPVLNLVLAVGLFGLWTLAGRARGLGRSVVVGVLVVLTVSAASMRFADRHQKDDYQTAAAIALKGLQQGQQVWWVADFLGAHYYRLPGTFDYMGELTSVHTPPACRDLPGVQAAANLSAECLQGLTPPDLVVLSRPETFDKSGDVLRYLDERGYIQVRELPAIVILQAPGRASPPRPAP